MRNNKQYPTAALALFLASCSGNSSAFEPARATSSSFGIRPGPRIGSSQQRTYSNQDLLYITTLGNVAYVLSYPEGSVLGSIKFKTNLSNLCVDAASNVYFVFSNQTESTIVEYAHGGSQPIQTFLDSRGSANSCSVDPTSGNLAVTNFDDGKGGSGSVVVYQNVSEQPQVYTNSHVPKVVSGAYDDGGNLLVDGNINFAILAKNSSELSDVTFQHLPKDPGTIVWDGSYFAVGNQFVSKRHWRTTISRLQIQGSIGTVASKVKLLGKKIKFGTVYNGVALAAMGTKQKQLGFWNYPAGGNTTKVVTGLARQTFLEDEAVSPATTPGK